MQCRSCSVDFELTPEEKAGYAKFGFPPIPECFTCMQMHKLSFRNGRSLYHRKCDATKKDIISIFSKDSPYTVYEREYWYSDEWDALQNGQDIDFNRPFFEQFRELQLTVPRMSLFNVNAENSDYCNMSTGNKDCYCVFGGDYNQNVLYGILCMYNKSSVDCDYGNHNELCYDLFESFNCYNCRSIVDSKNCTDCAYVSDCMSCKDCILCVNLKNKQYCIENVQLTKDDYLKRKEELLNGRHSGHVDALQKLHDMRKKRIVKYAHMISCEDCSGDFLENAKGCSNCFFVTDSQDITNAIFVAGAKDSFQSSFFGHNTGLCYQCMACIDANRCAFCYATGNASEAEYCDLVLFSKNVFGCIGLKHKQYCILNKQYTKEQYEELRGKLIEHMKKTGEWGEFFPKELSCFGYNETTAQEFFPLTEEQALEKGFSWYESREAEHATARSIPAKDLPDAISDIPDDVLNWAIQSERSGRAFRIIKQELDFYREHHIPLPRLHPEERFGDRFAQYANPPRLYARTCMKCNKAINTTYAPDRSETVYCEECYLSAVY